MQSRKTGRQQERRHEEQSPAGFKINQELTRENAEAILPVWAKTLCERPLDGQQQMTRAGLTPKGDIPKKTVLHQLYANPNAGIHDDGSKVVTVCLGMGKSRWDSSMGNQKHWQWLDPPEKMLGEGKNFYKKASQNEDITLFWKVHAVFRPDGTKYLALNPIQYNNHYPQDSEYIIRQLNAKQDELAKTEMPAPEKGRVRRHLRWAARRLTENPQAAIGQYSDRDRIAVATGITACKSLKMPALALPSEQVLRGRWESITDSTIKNYGRLASLSSENTVGVTTARFNSDLHLTEETIGR